MKRKIYVISFFVVLLLFCGGFFVGLEYHNHEISQQKKQLIIPEDMEKVKTQQGDIITTCDTEWSVQKYDKFSKTMTTEEMKIPAQYIGVTREQLQQMLKEYQKAPVLSDEKQGFQGISLVSFSKEKVTILKTYDMSGPQGYYLFSKGDEVAVYLADKKTLFFETGIEMAELPIQIQAQISTGKYFEEEESLYSFLESYTS